MDSQVFTTEKAAKVLGLPEWRVVRLAGIKKFGITPAFGEAAGPGTRRLYNLENICELGLAVWLLEAGLRIEVVGRVLNQQRKTKHLTLYLSQDTSEVQYLYLGVLRKPKGKIMGQEAFPFRATDKLSELFAKNADASLVVIPIGLRFLALKDRLEQQY